MKKVININFQGRVIPIEETAYDMLKQYIESLRRYFANEEGRDEIINDIESRVAELFAEKLKKGAVCITDADVSTVMASMGRPEDFEAESQESFSNSQGQQQQESSSSQAYTNAGSSNTSNNNAFGRGPLYRNADDKILGGVASGLANYINIDPVFMRILFVLLSAPLFWVYILLWVIIPSKSVQANITKRLYRSADDKVIGGVCGGLAVYFNINTWIPRLIFALPLVLGIFSGPFSHWWWNDWDWHVWGGPRIISGSLSSFLFFGYIILWIALPVAVTSAEKLEMRGEKVDLNSIRNTVKEKAQAFGNEVKQSAQDFSQKAKEFGQEATNRAKVFSEEAAPMARSAGHGVGHAIGVIFKAFFLLIAGSIALALFGVLVGLLFGGLGFSAFPLKDFVLDGFRQNLLAWGVLLLFIAAPVVALLTWLVRRIIGVKSRKHYLGYVFGTLWFVGIICLILLVTSIGSNFRIRIPIVEPMYITQPSGNLLLINVQNDHRKYYERSDFWDINSRDWPFYGVNDDTLRLNTVRVSIGKSADGLFHITKVRSGRGKDANAARQAAESIAFNIVQQDSLLMLPRGIFISNREKFRNQQVTVAIEIPVGKRFYLGRNVSEYNWFDVRYTRSGFTVTDRYRNDDEWDGDYSVSTGVEYVMTEDGPKRTSGLNENPTPDTEKKEKPVRRYENAKDSGYRYHPQRSNPVSDTVSKKQVRSI